MYSCLSLTPATVIEAVARDPWLRAFTGRGRVETCQARQARWHLLLDKIAQAFEPGVRYSERRVSLFLGVLHADYAALRRYLVDEKFLSHSDGQYWRSGGTVLPSRRMSRRLKRSRRAVMTGLRAAQEPLPRSGFLLGEGF